MSAVKTIVSSGWESARAVLRRIRNGLAGCQYGHLTCFNTTPLERALALALNLPLYATDPALAHLGTKSGSREIFRAAGVNKEAVRDA